MPKTRTSEQRDRLPFVRKKQLPSSPSQPLAISPSTPLPENTLKDERLISFQSAADRERFIQKVKRAGIQLLAVSLGLNAVHDDAQVAALQQLLPDSAKIEFNYLVTTPPLSIPEARISGKNRSLSQIKCSTSAAPWQRLPLSPEPSPLFSQKSRHAHPGSYSDTARSYP